METTTKTFADFGVPDTIASALADAGITHPFPIQELTLPLALGGADLIGQARTGTGKTLAFGVPLLSRVDPAARHTQVLAVVPTRELALQVRDDIARAGAKLDLSIEVFYGGRPIEPQMEAIRRGVQVVVGTPGRLLDLMNRGGLDISTVKGLVLDEADEMLDLGFLPDVERIIQATPADRQTLLFSATMPSAVVGLARRYLTKPTFLRAEVEEPQIGERTRQYFFSCHRMDKPAVLARILSAPGRGRCVVFSRTKRMADQLAAELKDLGIRAAPIHSDLRQEARERALTRFRDGSMDVLVATEVAARGLDITDVTHVVNYDCPDDEKMYLHRIGRTGRAGAAGVAITLALWNELARLEMIKRTLEIDEPTHEVFSTSPILAELFDLDSAPAAEGRVITPRGPKGAEDARPASGSRGGRGRRDGRGRSDERSGRGDARSGRGDAAPTESRTKDEAPSHQEVPPAGDDAARDGANAVTRAQPAAREDAGVRRRTRTRTRSGDARAAGSARTTGESPSGDATGGPSPTAAADGASSDEDAPRPRNRTRTRTRPPADARPGGDGASGRTADDNADAGGRDRDDGGAATSDGRPPTRVRTRTRTRSTDAAPRRSGSARSDRPGDSDEAPSGRRGGSSTRSGGATKETASGSDDDRGATGSGDASSRRSDGGRGGRGGSGSGRSGSSRDSQRRGRSSRGGRGGRSGRSEGGRDATVDAGQARGSGQPRIRRPMDVTHIP